MVRRLDASQTVDLALGPQLSRTQARFVHAGLPVDVTAQIIPIDGGGLSNLVRGADDVYRSDFPVRSGKARIVLYQSSGFVNGINPFYWTPPNPEVDLAPGINNLGRVELVLNR